MCGCAYLAQRATFVKLRGKRLGGCFLVMYGNWGSSAKNHSSFRLFGELEVFTLNARSRIVAFFLDFGRFLGGSSGCGSGCIRFGCFNFGAFGGFLFFFNRHLLGSDEHNHALTLEHGHRFDLAIFFEVVGKTQQQHFALLFEEDGTSAEENVGFHAVAFGKETFGVLELEVLVVVVGLRTKSNFLYFDFDLLSFELFLTLLLLVDKLRIVNQSTNGRLGIGANLNEVEALLLCEAQGIAGRHNATFNIIADNAHFTHADLFVHAILLLDFIVLVGSQMSISFSCI